MKRLRGWLALSCLGALSILATSAGSETRPANKGLTFNKDVAPIFLARCVKCHRKGEPAPMSLASYEEARPWARSIREKVLLREMPPWHADPRFGEFKNDRRLTQDEIDTIVAWVDGGAKQGDPDQGAVALRLVEGWNIGNPDLVLSMPQEITLNAAASDEYYYIEIPASSPKTGTFKRSRCGPAITKSFIT
jgi:hypothetical protein